MANGLPDLVLPGQGTGNFASKAMQLLYLNSMMGSQTTPEERSLAGQTAATNAAAAFMQAQTQQGRLGLDTEKLIEEQRKTAVDESIKANEFALSLLSGVTSAEDLDIVKRQFTSRYPEAADMVERLLPSYSERGVALVQNALRDETAKLNMAKQKWDETKPTAIPAGSAVFEGGKMTGQVPFKPDKPSYEVFEGPDGNQVYVREGDVIPTGFKRVAKSPGVVVNTGDNLTKPVTSQLQKDVIEGVQNIASFRGTAKLFKRDYLTVLGKGENWLATLMDKGGVATKGQRKLIAERAAWYRQSKADFLAFRKWATGVAGGEKELGEIATAFPNPDTNSPTQYMSNMKSLEETTKRVLMLNADFLASGIDLNQPLTAILRQAQELGIEPPPESVPVGGGTSGSWGEEGEGKVIEYDATGKRIK